MIYYFLYLFVDVTLYITDYYLYTWIFVSIPLSSTKNSHTVVFSVVSDPTVTRSETTCWHSWSLPSSCNDFTFDRFFNRLHLFVLKKFSPKKNYYFQSYGVVLFYYDCQHTYTIVSELNVFRFHLSCFWSLSIQFTVSTYKSMQWESQTILFIYFLVIPMFSNFVFQPT